MYTGNHISDCSSLVDLRNMSYVNSLAVFVRSCLYGPVQCKAQRDGHLAYLEIDKGKEGWSLGWVRF